MAADPRWIALERSDWEDVAAGLDFAAWSADQDAEEIRRGYSMGSDEERVRLIANANLWRGLSESIASKATQ